MAEERHPVERRSPRETARLVFGVILLVIVGAVVVDNRHDTSVGYVVGDVRAPLIIVLLITAVVGGLIGWLLLHRAQRHK